MRGNQRGGRLNLAKHRSIPACAGEPVCAACSSRRLQVYPRVCGGTWRFWGVDDAEVGLSPRVRGNPAPIDPTGPAPRSIPACAGEPAQSSLPSWWTAVYPRVCGGTQAHILALIFARGLSPRVRGNPGVGHTSLTGDGSIPACAGEPDCQAAIHALDSVYPRVCGGTICSFIVVRSSIGLSPRVRGNRLERRGRKPLERSIPACAGEPR